jgi:hypothetical protein
LDERLSATSRQPLSIVNVASVRDPRDLGATGVQPLLLVRRVDDRPRHRVIPPAGDEQQRAAVRSLAVDLRLGPRIEVDGQVVLEVVQIRADSFVLGQGRQRELGDDQSNARDVRELKYFAEGWGAAAAL